MTDDKMTLGKAMWESTDEFVGVFVKFVLFLPKLLFWVGVPFLIILSPIILFGITEKTFVQSLFMFPIGMFVAAFILTVTEKMGWF